MRREGRIFGRGDGFMDETAKKKKKKKEKQKRGEMSRRLILRGRLINNSLQKADSCLLFIRSPRDPETLGEKSVLNHGHGQISTGGLMKAKK